MFQFIILFAYCLIAAAAIAMTLLEGWTHHDRWTLRRMAGLVACLAWPVVAVAFVLHNLIASRHQRHQPEFLANAAER